MFDLSGKSACLKNQGKMRSDQEHATCDSVGGYVPQEQTTQYQSDRCIQTAQCQWCPQTVWGR